MLSPAHGEHFRFAVHGLQQLLMEVKQHHRDFPKFPRAALCLSSRSAFRQRSVD